MKNKIAMKTILKISSTYKKDGDIKWNFTKFLIDREGKVINRFAPSEKPEKFEEEVSKAILG